MVQQVVHTSHAPAAIGPYSQAIRVGDTVYLSGQIGLDPITGQMLDGLEAQANRVLANIAAVAEACGGTLASVVKLTLFLADLGDFAKVNEIMAARMSPPYPARSTVGVAALPRGARIEIEAVLVVPG